VHENPTLFVCWVDIDISGLLDCYICLCIFWHPSDSRYNTTLFLELIGSNLSWSWYF
jgi:hypothetical protein